MGCMSWAWSNLKARAAGSGERPRRNSARAFFPVGRLAGWAVVAAFALASSSVGADAHSFGPIRSSY